MNVISFNHACHKRTLLLASGALCMLCAFTACDGQAQEVDERAELVVTPPMLPPITPPAASPSAVRQGTADEVDQVRAIQDDVRDIEGRERSGLRTEPPASDSRSLDELIDAALATREGREMVAPLLAREERSTPEPSSQTISSQTTSQQVFIRVEAPSPQPTQPQYGAGLSQETALPIFVDPTGQPVEGAMPAHRVPAQPTSYYRGSVPLPTSLSPDASAQRRAPSSRLVPQIPPRSALPSQVPDTARAPAVSGPGVAGF